MYFDPRRSLIEHARDLQRLLALYSLLQDQLLVFQNLLVDALMIALKMASTVMYYHPPK